MHIIIDSPLIPYEKNITSHFIPGFHCRIHPGISTSKTCGFKSQAKTVARFDINAQGLFVVKLSNGKEIKSDLTHFAFDYGQNNPERYKNGLKNEIGKALK